MKQLKKQGFTIVELVIVIAIIAILAAVLIPTFSNLIRKANESKDTQLVRNLNTALAADVENEHKTMQSALDAAEKFGYNVGKINASATGNEILWDSANDVFCYLKDGEISYIPETTLGTTDVKDYQYWQIVKEVPAAQTYSLYAGPEFTAETVDVTVGFDAGTITGITTVNYSNSGDAQTVVIRAISAKTNLTIDAPADTIYHYDTAGAVDVIRTANGSYHEAGKTAFIQVASGRVVAEAGSKVEAVVLTEKGDDATLDAILENKGGAVTNTYATSEAVIEANNADGKSVQLTVENNKVEFTKGTTEEETADNLAAAITKIKKEVVSAAVVEEEKENDEQLLYNINKLLAVHEMTDGKIISSKKAYAFLEDNGVKAESVKSARDGYQFYFNITKNRFELIDTTAESHNDISDIGYYQAFNAEYKANGKKGYTGYETFTGSTTFTYKYFDAQNNVYEGETVTEDNTIYYWLHVPFNYKEYKEYPILTFLHGTNASLYVQSNESCTGYEARPLSDFATNDSFALRMLSGAAKSGAGHQGELRSNMFSDGSMNVMGANGGDDCFIWTLIDDIKQDESLDCFIVLLQFNDELWWENRAQYTINVNGEEKTVQQLDIHSSYKVGLGDKVDSKSYAGTYTASALGPNVWFQLLDQLYDKLCSEYSINQDRQYVMGHSLGGLATFDLISHYPDRFAAAVPNCAAGADPSTENIARITQTKVLCMHGASDGWVSSEMGRLFIEELNKQYPGHGEFIGVPGKGHDISYLKNNSYQYGYDYVKDFLFGSERN